MRHTRAWCDASGLYIGFPRRCRRAVVNRDFGATAWRIYQRECAKHGGALDWPTFAYLRPVLAQVCRRLWYRYSPESVPMIARSVPAPPPYVMNSHYYGQTNRES